jgi:DNA mismatch endonuclease (patch repair protein)
MTDIFSPEKRSDVMAGIKGRNTKPEKIVRSLLHRMGYRFRLHCKELPGRPDIVLPRFKTVIFVHGCFWHRHKGCKFAYTPKTRTNFWISKLEANACRDQQKASELTALGWQVITIWECELQNMELLAKRLSELLTSPVFRVRR